MAGGYRICGQDMLRLLGTGTRRRFGVGVTCEPRGPGLWPFLTRVGVRAASPCPSHRVSGVPITGVLSLPPGAPPMCQHLPHLIPPSGPTADNEKAPCVPFPSHPCLSSGASCVVVTCNGCLRPSPTCHLEASHNCRVVLGTWAPHSGLCGEFCFLTTQCHLPLAPGALGVLTGWALAVQLCACPALIVRAPRRHLCISGAGGRPPGGTGGWRWQQMDWGSQAKASVGSEL